jgi:hypothetical protein
MTSRWDEFHQYALDEAGEWIHARDAKKSEKYYCDCPDRHILKLVGPSGRACKRSFKHYFAHYGTSTCTSGGESMIHRLAKHKLRELVSTLTFVMERCPGCKRPKRFRASGHTISLEVRSEDGLWRYDCLLKDARGTPVFALEVAHTHFSSLSKLNAIRSHMGFAEFNAKHILEATDGSLENLDPVQNVLCFECKSKGKSVNIAVQPAVSSNSGQVQIYVQETPYGQGKQRQTEPARDDQLMSNRQDHERLRRAAIAKEREIRSFLRKVADRFGNDNKKQLKLLSFMTKSS